MNPPLLVSIIIIITVLILLIAYIIFIFESYKESKFIFTPFVPNPPANTFNPLGAVFPLTPDQIAIRNSIIQS